MRCIIIIFHGGRRTMTIAAATGGNRGRNFLQPGVILECPLRTPWKQRLVEGGVCSREDNIVRSAHEDIAFSSGMHTKEHHQFSFRGHFVFSHFRGDENVGPTTKDPETFDRRSFSSKPLLWCAPFQASHGGPIVDMNCMV